MDVLGPIAVPIDQERAPLTLGLDHGLQFARRLQLPAGTILRHLSSIVPGDQVAI